MISLFVLLRPLLELVVVDLFVGVELGLVLEFELGLGFFALENALLRPGLDVEFHGELAVVVYLVPAQRVVVELEALQVDDQRVARLVQKRPLVHLDLLVVLLAVVLVVALQDVRLDVEIKRLLDTFFVLDVELHREKRLDGLRHVLVLVFEALDLAAQLAAEDLFEQLLVGGRLELGLESVEQDVEELLCVLLPPDIHWAALNADCFCEVARGVVLLLCLLQVCEHELQLEQRAAELFVCLNCRRQNAVPEVGNHEQLLDHRVHVARGSEVLQTREA
mmetsp:Transcript_1402/g.1599  ORF Transcript_1402/g.1599 Transcript_1402/m.1599 type:complete len:278 (+) Transcript_1402:1495-2328(+)